MYKLKIITPLLASILFIGCGASKKQVNLNFEIPVEIEESTTTVFNNGISIHGMEGAYPKSSKDKQLGQGMFNHKFFDIVKIVQKNLSEIIDSTLLIEIKTKDSQPEVDDIVKEAIKYFTLHRDFDVRDGRGKLADIVINIKEDNSVKFEIKYQEDSEIFKNDRTVIVDLGMSINEISNESTATWSKVQVKDARGDIVSPNYQIMKNAVTVSQKNPKMLGNQSVTNVKYSNADDFCAKKYDGFVAPIYIYEYALRQGLINPPSSGINKEMISGYDNENEDDIRLFREGDIVQSASSKDESADFSEIVVFNYKSQKYTFKRDNFTSKSVTFRCAR